MSTSESESDLVAAAAAGDADAFASLMRTHEGRVRATCRRILGDATATEDCTQDTFTNAWRALSRFDRRSAFATWLYRIAANEALQALRRRRPLEVLTDEPPLDAASDIPGPGIERIGRDEVRAVVRKRLLELPDALRIPVVLRDVEDWSNEEIATAIGLSVPATKARIHRGRMKLRALLALDFPDRG